MACLRLRSVCCWFCPAAAKDDGEWTEPLLRPAAADALERKPSVNGDAVTSHCDGEAAMSLDGAKVRKLQWSESTEGGEEGKEGEKGARQIPEGSVTFAEAPELNFITIGRMSMGSVGVKGSDDDFAPVEDAQPRAYSATVEASPNAKLSDLVA